MPFGTKGIAESSEKLGDSIKNMIESTTELGKDTQILAQTTQGLIESNFYLKAIDRNDGN